jgi:hypothetical protein
VVGSVAAFKFGKIPYSARIFASIVGRMRQIDSDKRIVLFFQDFEWRSLWDGEVDSYVYSEWIDIYDLSFLFYGKPLGNIVEGEPIISKQGSKLSYAEDTAEYAFWDESEALEVAEGSAGLKSRGRKGRAATKHENNRRGGKMNKKNGARK